MKRLELAEPLAVVGQACVLPGARTPAALWELVREKRDVVTEVPAGRFRLDPALVAARPPPGAVSPADLDATWSTRGGYVDEAYDTVDESGLDLERGALQGLDPLFHWVIATGRDALVDAGFDVPLRGVRAGAVLGNLSFPTEAMTLFGEQALLDGLDPKLRKALGAPWSRDVDARNRFMSGLPAHLLARALHLDAGAFALDAACASSLYAIRLAALALSERRADVMLAGAVNRADSLFLHVGFCALQALSTSGVPRPFDRRADGLVPAEGCAVVALMRLDDAVAQGKRIACVIRGVGLANDGRSKNLLAPSSEGQVRAIRAAWETAGLDPASADYVECHATGTPTGDSTEVATVAEAFATASASRPLPVGSLKSNVGHLITAAGAAGLIKVAQAFAHEELPPSIHAEEPLDILDGRLRIEVQREPAAWPARADRPRRAGISAFGFGGNNAHVVVEEHRPRAPHVSVRGDRAPHASSGLAVVALAERTSSTTIALDGLRFPPHDLKASLAQQLLVFEAARDAVAALDVGVDRGEPLPRERTGVFIGMGADVRVTSPGLRWRAPEIARRLSDAPSPSFVDAIRDAACDVVSAQRVLGCMPNIPANRLNVQLDLRGPGFTISAEEHSGLHALDVARALIDAGEIDAAIVGATEAARDPRHTLASALARPNGTPASAGAPGADGAVVLIVMREARARALGLPVLALVSAPARTSEPVAPTSDVGSLDELALSSEEVARARGDTHAALGLFAVAAAVTAVSSRRRPLADVPWISAGLRQVRVDVRALEVPARTVVVTAADAAPDRADSTAGAVGSAAAHGRAPLVFTTAAADSAALVEALRSERAPSSGAPHVHGETWRAAVVARDHAELAAKRAELAARLAANGRVDDDARGMFARAAPALPREGIALLFGTAGTVSPGMADDLLLAFPDVGDALARAVGAERLRAILALERHPRGCLGDLLAASAVMQIQAAVARDVLAVPFASTIGVSLGESNALFASGAWPELAPMLEDMERSGLFDGLLFGAFTAARAHWRARGRPDLADAEVPWRAVLVRAPVDDVRRVCAAGLCFPLVIHADDEVEIGGAPDAVDDAVRALGAFAVPLAHMPAVHCPLLDPAGDGYRALHRRPTRAVDVRTFSHGTMGVLDHRADVVADALLAQGRSTVDFPALLRAAAAHGVRAIVDVSPRGLAGTWAARTLPGVDVVSVDGLAGACAAAARLFVAGAPVDLSRLHALASHVRAPSRTLVVDDARAARPFPTPPAPTQRMTRPPALPRVLPVELPARSTHEARGAGAEPAPSTSARNTAAQPTGADPARSALEVAPDAVAAHRERALEAHRGLIESMARGHAAFLVHRHASVQRLVALGHVDERAVWDRPLWDRADLERLASGRIADVLGEQFAVQDAFRRQVRMPQPPLLLADRVLSIDAQPGVLEKQRTIVTETDVRWDSWYLHAGRCPAGVLIETGQADLLLISYMGVDFENKGERVYRLLGCDLTYNARLPLAGTTLRHEITIDGYATHGDVRIFFFHSETAAGTRPALSVENGQAGFFTDDELANSGGVLWKPEDVPRAAIASLPFAVAPHPTEKRALSRADLEAFAARRVTACFGPSFSAASTHVRTPSIASGDMLLVDRVTHLDLAGGPWGRGYVRAELDLRGDNWFFDGHFKDDPCMPGTIMFEGCLQVLAIHAAACGFTLARDGFVFEPAVGKRFKLRCRGQATPSSKSLVYELFVKSIVDGPEPAVVADVLVTVDGLKSLHCEDVELKLARDWPTTSAARPARDPALVADEAALLASAIGRPSLAFPSLYEPFDDAARVARLPGPPYKFMDRVVALEGQGAPWGALARGESAAGTSAVVEYDAPADAWFFKDGAMPFAVLLEVALQPCGWVSSVVGSTLTGDNLYYRNLDGQARVHREVTRDVGTLVTRATLLKSSSSGGMIIQEHAFAVTTKAGAPVFDGTTVFGFFPPDALARQVGAGSTEIERARMVERCAGFDAVDLGAKPARYFGALPLPGEMLLMLDRVTGYWPAASSTGRARVRAEKRVDPGEWFFKAHFFQDPVQPGSLGVEAMAQALMWTAIHEQRHAGMARPRFQSLAPGTGDPVVWKYRGQVLPTNALVQVEVDIVDVVEQRDGVLLKAAGSLWVDGLKIYAATGMSLRIVDDG